MPTLNYAAPSTVDEAVKLLAGASGLAKVLSGGTDLLVQMRAGRLKPELIVDTKQIPGLIGIREEGGGFVVGAATPGAVVEAHPGMNKAWPGVVEALDLIGSTQIQGRCSLAGNLCNASPAADSVPALFAAGAIAVVVGSKGRREVPVEQIPAGPGRTNLAKDEFILEFKFPPRAPHSGDAYLRFIPRTEMDIAVVGCGINVTLDGKGVCTAARVGLGAVAPTVLLVKDAADALIGHTLDEETLKKLDAAARAACKPINDKRGTIEYRTKVAGVLARRVAAIAFDRAMGKSQGKNSLMSKHHVSTTINGEPVEFLCETQQTMLDTLRDVLGLTGSKEGCASGDCGACTIICDGKIVCSCLMLGVEAAGKTITTIEGIAQGDHLHPVQQKFLEHAALQCGFCTPGFIVAAKALLDENPNPTETEARYWLAGNLCRCTGYDKIIRAVMDAAAEMRGEAVR